MPSTQSPNLGPAYTCGTHVSVLELDDESAFISTLNPGAAEFMPSFYPIEDSSDEARRVDDIMRMMHHLVSVSDSEHLVRARQFAEDNDAVDDDICWALGEQDALVQHLYVAPNKPKGSTYGRKHERHSRNSHH
jgi:hypothetical protein